MSEKPILFNTEMVRAIFDGRKTVTRRVIRFPEGTTGRLPPSGARDYIYWPGGIKRAPYKPGDILWVRERFAVDDEGQYHYYADTNYIEPLSWKPSIHMPREAARIFLRVTNVRCERLQEMQSVDAYKEGFCKGLNGDMQAFYHTWESTIKDADRKRYGWQADPWVWVIEFEKTEPPKEEDT